jgi:casein kinase II subunit beta
MTDSDSSDDSGPVRKPWLDSFFEQPSSDWFCRVPPAFALDGFNTFGLRIDQQHAKSAFALLIGTERRYHDSDSYDSDSEDAIEKCVEVAFGLIHARYIFTPEGLSDMNKKYQQGTFGTCPRLFCGDQHLLPLGFSDRPNVDTVKVYCPKCRQIYEADEQHRNLDGAYFTKSFPHYFLMELKNLNSLAHLERAQSGDIYVSESLSVGRVPK